MGEHVTLDLGDSSVQLDVHESTLGQPGVDVLKLRASTHHVTYDPGFGNTAAARRPKTC